MTSLIRKATEEERKYYHQRLYPLQDEIFKGLADFWKEGFYLTGGTALSRFYYKHRFSADLDFFFDGKTYDNSRFKVLGAKLIDLISVEHEVEVSLEAEFFKRLFIRGEVDMKIEIVFDPYKRAGSLQESGGICIDSKENIAANKFSAVSGRKMTKDFFDLFFLLREIEFNDAVGYAKYKHVPLDYEGIMLAVGDLLSSPAALEGQILTEVEVDETEFKAFVRDLIEKLIIHARSQ
jgi:predicted nucleotidyltransferase component of viral defense system